MTNENISKDTLKKGLLKLTEIAQDVKFSHSRGEISFSELSSFMVKINAEKEKINKLLKNIEVTQND